MVSTVHPRGFKFINGQAEECWGKKKFGLDCILIVFPSKNTMCHSYIGCKPFEFHMKTTIQHHYKVEGRQTDNLSDLAYF